MIRVLRLCGVNNRNVIKRISYRQSSTAVTKLHERLKTGPNLNEFLVVGKNLPIPGRIDSDKVPYINPIDLDGSNRKVFFEVYGCQMNVSDTEIVWSILQNSGYSKTDDIKMADVILVVTCAIREGAEKKIWNRLRMLAEFKNTRSINHGPLQIGVLGCMAERIKTKFLEEEKIVDIVAGPDSYKDLPRLLAITKTGPRAVNTLLSLDETYADVLPVRLDEKKITAFVSIMRGCDNMCTYCIVPFTRGRERSRPVESLINEVKHLANQGVKEITLLGQNVNSYRDVSQHKDDRETDLVDGFKTVYKHKKGGLRFGRLLELVATAVPDVRIRFTSPHPKDFPDDVLYAIRNHNNVCKSIHLPAQSGNSEVLERMRRGYSREAYLKLVEHIRNILPNVALSSDFICGFCGETEEEFTDTESLISIVKYNVAYLFEYSMREKTTAHRRFKDDVPGDVKNERLKRMVSAFREGASELNAKFIGEKQLILIEDFSKRSKLEVYGRNDANIKVIVPIESIPKTKNSSEVEQIKAGDFIAARVTETNSQVLKGIPLYHTSISEFYNE